MKSVLLDGERLTLEDLEAIADRHAPVALAPAAATAVDAARAVVDAKASGDVPVYGINTGFGSLAEVKIPKDALGELQRNLLRSHAAGVDEPLPARAVRAMMDAARQRPGEGILRIRRGTLDRLIAALNARVHPDRAGARLGRRQRRPAPARASSRSC
jgi:histidine ammonia-lyase